MSDENSGGLLRPARAVCSRYDIVTRTLTRWEDDPDLGFPMPVIIRNRRYWREDDLVLWERARARKREAV
jgi:hypothetical protein